MPDKNGWISVEERAPEEYVPVLVYIPHLDDEAAIQVAVRTFDGDWDGPMTSWEREEITHWQPRPDPPEDEMSESPRWDAYEAECHHHGLEPTQEGFEEAVMELGMGFIQERIRRRPDLEWTPYFLEQIGPYIAEQGACRAEAQRDAQEDR